MSADAIYHDLFAQITPTVTILTPNRRLSATLLQSYQAYQTEQQRVCWNTPDILPLTSWIERAWSQYAHAHFATLPFILNPIQEQYLWEQILTASHTSALLLQVAETAANIKSAWILLKQWNLSVTHSQFDTAEDYLALREWSELFQEKCRQQSYLDSASMTDHVIELILQKKIPLPEALILTGFTEIAPQFKKLLAHCASLGCKVECYSPNSKHSTSYRLSLSDQEAEIVAMARWAKALNLATPTARIACVIPDLEKVRDRVAQIFAEVFAPSDALAIQHTIAPFNISAGKSLLQYPIINTALQLLTLYKKQIPLDVFCYLLSSPFIGGADTERFQRSLFDKMLRLANVTTINVRKLLVTTEDSKQLALTRQCPLFTHYLQAFYTALNQDQHKHPFHVWAQQFNHLLSNLGWPGERSLNSEEYQLVETWLELLNQFSQLDQISAPVDLAQALQALQRLAGTTIFQAKTPSAPIQILGILEAAGLPFDQVWMAGMDDLTWPPQPKPHPFIPRRLQRELQMPHATAERELLFCRNIMQQFLACSKLVIFSHAEKNAELELQPSPLIRELTELSLAALPLADYYSVSERIYQTKQLEVLVDERAPELALTTQLKGGISVLKQQALCPFKSFAEWRLHAQELESPLPGLRAKDRGNIIHKSLELFWNTIQNHDHLMQLATSELETSLDASVTQALASVYATQHHSKQYLSLEKQRVLAIMRDWLEVEKQRPTFRVLKHEEINLVTLGNLQFRIRIDRIDELPDGSKLIIDYKTSKNNDINAWFGLRPEEPQLPVYSLLDPQATTGITFAQVYAGEHCFKGVSRYTLDIDGIKPISDIKKTTALNWQEQIVEWQTTLTQLSDSFYAGIAHVDPKQPPQTCLWCALQPLCRINEEISA